MAENKNTAYDFSLFEPSEKERGERKKKDNIIKISEEQLEASRRTVRSYVDFVLTFEELQGMFDAKNVNFKELPDGEPLMQASADGRGFAASGGVAAAVVKAVKRMDPDREVKVVSAEGLANCKKMMQLAKAGKYNG